MPEAHQIHEDGAGHVAAAAGFIEVHVDPLQLQVGVAGIAASGIHAVLITDHLRRTGQAAQGRQQADGDCFACRGSMDGGCC